MREIAQALISLRPGARWSYDSTISGIAGVTWLDEHQAIPTEDELVAEMERLSGPPSKEQRVAEKLATRGLTAETEWQLYAGIAGMVALGKSEGKTLAQMYATNTGYRNALDLHLAITAIRAEAGP